MAQVKVQTTFYPIHREYRVYASLLGCTRVNCLTHFSEAHWTRLRPQCEERLLRLLGVQLARLVKSISAYVE